MSMHKCLNCGKTREFDEYEFDIKESATLKCPTCNAVFRIDAVMTDPGNKAGDEQPLTPDESPGEEQPPEPGAEETPPGEEAAPGGESELELTPQESTGVRKRGKVLSEASRRVPGGALTAYEALTNAFDAVEKAAQMCSSVDVEKRLSEGQADRWAKVIWEMHTKLADFAERHMTSAGVSTRKLSPHPQYWHNEPTREPVAEARVVKPTKAEVSRVCTYALVKLCPIEDDLQYDTFVYLGDLFGLDLRQHVPGGDMEESLREAAEKTEWKGDFATFNAKLFGLAGSLDLPIEQVEIIIQELTDAKALTLSGDKVEIDLKKAKTVLIDFMHAEHEKAEIESGTAETQPSTETPPAPEAAPEEQPVHLGTAPVSESEDQDEVEELEKRVERVIAKFFESVKIHEKAGHSQGDSCPRCDEGELQDTDPDGKGRLVCSNPACEFEVPESKRNDIEFSGAGTYSTGDYADAEAFVSFLLDTLIPDLKTDGQDATAEDFEAAVNFIKAPEARDIGEWDSAEQFVEYLRNTLIPDLKSSGKVETARSFETAISFIEAAQE